MTTQPDVSLGSGQMFDNIAPRYDFLNRLMSFGMDRYWRWRMIRSMQIPESASVLDVATGTGDVSLQLLKHHKDIRVTGIDPSVGMLQVARDKAAKRSVSHRLKFVEGDAQHLPFSDDGFHASCIAFGIRNVPDRRQGLAEMFRVTRPGGMVAVLELGEPDEGLLAPFAKFHVRHIVPRLGALLSGATEYDYLQQSINAFPATSRFSEMMSDISGNKTVVKRFAFGACNLYLSVAR